MSIAGSVTIFGPILMSINIKECFNTSLFYVCDGFFGSLCKFHSLEYDGESTSTEG